MTNHDGLNVVNILSLLICLIPLCLVTGPFLPDLLTVICVLFFLYSTLKNKIFFYFNNFFFKFFFLFWLYLIFSSLSSDFVFFSLKSSIPYIRFIILPLVVWYLIDNNKNFFKQFMFFLVLAYIIGISSGIYQYIYGQTIFGTNAVSTRLYLLASDNLALGHFLSRLFPLLVAMMLYNLKKNKLYFISFFILFISTDVLIFLSGERTSLGLLFISTVFILILIKNLKLFRLITLLFSLSLIIIISIYIPEIKERNVDTTLNQLGLSQESENLYIFSPIHEQHIFTSLEIFKSNIIIGAGPNNFSNLCENEDYNQGPKSCSTHPHNLYVQILAEIGIIGFIFILVINFILSIKIIEYMYSYIKDKKFILNDFQICILCCFFVTLWPLIPTHNFFNNWINIIFYLPVGFYLQSIYGKNKVN